MICPTCKKEVSTTDFYFSPAQIINHDPSMQIATDLEFGSVRIIFNCPECNNLIIMTFKLDVVC